MAKRKIALALEAWAGLEAELVTRLQEVGISSFAELRKVGSVPLLWK